MKSIQALTFAFVLFGLIGGINFGYPTQDQNEFSAHINVNNDGHDDHDRLYGWSEKHDSNADLDDVSVRMYIPDLGLMYTSHPFDVDDHNTKSKFLHGYESADLCGQWVRISVGNDDVRRTKYRPILC